MIHFERVEAELQAAVGLSSEAILSGLEASSAGQLAEVRERFDRYVEAQGGPLTPAERLERDRLRAEANSP